MGNCPRKAHLQLSNCMPSSVTEGSPHTESYACVFQGRKPPLENEKHDQQPSGSLRLARPRGSHPNSSSPATEVLISLGDQRLTVQFISTTEVLTSLRDQRLIAQFISTTKVLTSLRDQHLTSSSSPRLKSSLHSGIKCLHTQR